MYKKALTEKRMEHKLENVKIDTQIQTIWLESKCRGKKSA